MLAGLTFTLKFRFCLTFKVKQWPTFFAGVAVHVEKREMGQVRLIYNYTCTQANF